MRCPSVSASGLASLVLASALGAGAHAQTVRAFGVDNDPLDALVEVGADGELVVSTATGGAFGTTFQTGDVLSAAMSYHVETETPADAWVETRFVHAGGTNTVRMARAEGGYEVETEFLGASTFAADVYLDGKLVHQAEGLGDGDVFISSDEEWSIFCWTIKCRYCQYHGDEYYWSKEEDTAITPPRDVVVDGSAMPADFIVFRPEGGQGAGPLTGIETMASGIETFSIRSQARGYGEDVHEVPHGHPEGGHLQAGFGSVLIEGEADATMFKVSEFDAAGEVSGVRTVMPPDAAGWTATIEQAVEAPMDASISATAFAMVDGIIDRELATASATQLPPGVQLHGQFFTEAAGAPRIVEAWLGDDLAASWETPDDATADRWPDAWTVANACDDCDGPSAGFSWVEPTLLFMAGEVVECDRLTLRPTSFDAGESIMTSVETSYLGIPCKVYKEVEIWGTASCAADVNGDAVLNVLDFVAFQQLFQSGDAGADANGDGALSVLDFIAFQELFLAGCN